MDTNRVVLVAEIMTEFARVTGLDPETEEPRRYLWTDAFAVCNYLDLHRLTGDGKWRELALRLVRQVHHTLGRHRADDRRSGWISGLSETEGESHPTIGGLRIGKELNERGPGERFDERREWDRDGQYFHYLTKWMHALGKVSRVTGDGKYLHWATELARTAVERFSFTPGEHGTAKRLYWKMSIDLRRPQVPSTGQHDALDGLVTCCELQAGGAAGEASPPLCAEIDVLTRMCRGQFWETDDTLGIGGLLFDAGRITQLMVAQRAGQLPQEELLERVLDSALSGLELISAGSALEGPATYRLAFRELGLSIGLHAAELLRQLEREHPETFDKAPFKRQLASLDRHLPLAGKIEEFWAGDGNRGRQSWNDHRDINMVMLATSLAPASFITL